MAFAKVDTSRSLRFNRALPVPVIFTFNGITKHFVIIKGLEKPFSASHGLAVVHNSWRLSYGTPFWRRLILFVAARTCFASREPM
jgi:hypothetical protein